MSTELPSFTIGMLLFPNLTQLDLTGPYEVFSRLPNAQVHLLAHTLDPVASDRGLKLLPTTRLDTCPPLDLICVPGGGGTSAMMDDEGVLSFLRMQARTARYITSVCTGALILASAGLLDGYRAATHWLSMELLPLFGAIPTHERVVMDRNRITGGGVTAGIDFALTVAAEIFGEDVAKTIQLTIEYNPQPPFNSGSPTVADPALVESVLAARREFQQKRYDHAANAAVRMKQNGAGDFSQGDS